MAVPTVDGRILLGWMERDEAISYLQKDCWFEPPLTEQQAEELWNTYKARVDNLPERVFQPLQRFPIAQAHRHLANNFLVRTKGPEVLDVININPAELVVFQKYVVIDRVEHHCGQPGDWPKKMLLVDRPVAQINLRAENGTVKAGLTHGEYVFEFHPQDGAFRIVQGGGFASVGEIDGRLLLKSGYHRSFAFVRAVKNELEANDKCVLVALTRSVPAQLLPGWPQPGLRTMVLGPRAPLFSDFFNDDFAMTVKLRKKRYEMHIRVETVAIDDP
jgi:hypothetical protein